jgi:hypothetical protein
MNQQQIMNKAEKAGWTDLTWTDVRNGVMDGSLRLLGFPPGDSKLGLKTAFPSGLIGPPAGPHPSTLLTPTTNQTTARP